MEFSYFIAIYMFLFLLCDPMDFRNNPGKNTGVGCHTYQLRGLK